MLVFDGINHFGQHALVVCFVLLLDISSLRYIQKEIQNYLFLDLLYSCKILPLYIAFWAFMANRNVNLLLTQASLSTTSRVLVKVVHSIGFTLLIHLVPLPYESIHLVPYESYATILDSKYQVWVMYRGVSAFIFILT